MKIEKLSGVKTITVTTHEEAMEARMWLSENGYTMYTVTDHFEHYSKGKGRGTRYASIYFQFLKDPDDGAVETKDTIKKYSDADYEKAVKALLKAGINSTLVEMMTKDEIMQSFRYDDYNEYNEFIEYMARKYDI